MKSLFARSRADRAGSVERPMRKRFSLLLFVVVVLVGALAAVPTAASAASATTPLLGNTSVPRIPREGIAATSPCPSGSFMVGARIWLDSFPRVTGVAALCDDGTGDPSLSQLVGDTSDAVSFGDSLCDGTDQAVGLKAANGEVVNAIAVRCAGAAGTYDAAVIGNQTTIKSNADCDSGTILTGIQGWYNIYGGPHNNVYGVQGTCASPQAITFTAPAGVTFGDPDSDLGATASSGLTVTYASTTPDVCTIVDGKLHTVSAGDCTIQADQAGDDSYIAAAPVARTFAIGKATQTITFAAPTGARAGGADADLGATSSSGLTVTYASTTPGVCTIVDGRLHVVSAGACTIRADQAGNGNYQAAPQVERTFSIAEDHVLGLTPTITGTPREGRTLTAHAGPVVPGDPTLAYQWRVNGHHVRGATRSRLKLGKAEAGRRVSVTIVAGAPGRIAQRATSAKTAIVSSARNRLVLSTRTVRSPSTFEVVATGLRPHQKYVIWLGGFATNTGRADEHGTVRRTVRFSRHVEAGKRRVRVSGYRGGKRTSTAYTTVRYLKR